MFHHSWRGKRNGRTMPTALAAKPAQDWSCTSRESEKRSFWDGRGREGQTLRSLGSQFQHSRELLPPCPWDELEVCLCSGQPPGVMGSVILSNGQGPLGARVTSAVMAESRRQQNVLRFVNGGEWFFPSPSEPADTIQVLCMSHFPIVSDLSFPLCAGVVSAVTLEVGVVQMISSPSNVRDALVSVPLYFYFFS